MRQLNQAAVLGDEVHVVCLVAICVSSVSVAVQVVGNVVRLRDGLQGLLDCHQRSLLLKGSGPQQAPHIPCLDDNSLPATLSLFFTTASEQPPECGLTLELYKGRWTRIGTVSSRGRDSSLFCKVCNMACVAWHT